MSENGYELRIDLVTPGTLPAPVRAAGEAAAAGGTDARLEGAWTVEFGRLNRYVELWHGTPGEEPAGAGGRERIALLDAHVHGVKAPAGAGHVYELRIYQAVPGRAGDWAANLGGLLEWRE